MSDEDDIRDLTPEEYDATYGSDGSTPEGIPDDALAQAIDDAEKMGAQE